MSSEVKRYDAVHLRYEDNNIRYGEGCEVEVVTARDYAALEAENARLQSAFDELAERYGKLQTGEDSLLARVVTERDAALAQLAAIQGGMGEANKHGAQPEVAENTGSHAMATNQLQRQEQAVARDVDGVAAPCEASPGDDIFAWATFDGEGSYDLRLFDGNESYRDDFRRNNPKHHPDWVFPLYRNSITAAMAAEVERVGKDYETAREAHDRVLSEMQDIKIKAQEVTDYHVRLLASALGECIQAAGISAPGVSLSGPQLLMFAVDLKETVIALRAELAIARRVIDRIGQLCTTPHESKERFIRRVQSVIEWEAQAISAKASP